MGAYVYIVGGGWDRARFPVASGDPPGRGGATSQSPGSGGFAGGVRGGRPPDEVFSPWRWWARVCPRRP
eukprot:gene14503-biopygen15674